MRSLVTAALALVLAAPAQAEIAARSDTGFEVREVAEVTASPEDSWKALIAPAGWWNGEHSFSGDAANLTIDPRPGGCFCEVLPGEGDRGFLYPRGGVEHMRVIFVEENKALRMSGALGPLQSEAVLGTLTVTLKPIDGGTRITFDYVVAGFMRYKQEQIAPAVDKVLGEQLTRLADKLGPKVSATEPKPAPGMESGR
jgi:hypothetical protein